MPQSLTTVETNLLRRLEVVIQEGMQQFLSVGNALTEIRDRRLYRVDYSTFEEYVEQKLNRTRQWAYQLIGSVTITQELPPELSTMVGTERVARAVARVPRNRRANVVRQAASNGPITARSIEESAKLNNDSITTDCEGYPLPDQVKPFFNRTKEIEELQKHIIYVARSLKKAAEDGDMMFAEVNTTGVVSDLRSINIHLSCAIPYAVCYQCQGHPAETGCAVCKGRGFISKRLMTTVPEEIRKIRSKEVKK